MLTFWCSFVYLLVFLPFLNLLLFVVVSWWSVQLDVNNQDLCIPSLQYKGTVSCCIRWVILLPTVPALKVQYIHTHPDCCCMSLRFQTTIKYIMCCLPFGALLLCFLLLFHLNLLLLFVVVVIVAACYVAYISYICLLCCLPSSSSMSVISLFRQNASKSCWKQ